MKVRDIATKWVPEPLRVGNTVLAKMFVGHNILRPACAVALLESVTGISLTKGWREVSVRVLSSSAAFLETDGHGCDSLDPLAWFLCFLHGGCPLGVLL